MEKTPHLRILKDACTKLVDSAEFNDFWILSSFTDRSYEEGDRNVVFKAEVERYAAVGLPKPFVAQLRKGINGNLEECLKPHVTDVARNKWEGQDLTFAVGNSAPALVEVKLVYDCTQTRHYSENITHDVNKLRELKAQGYLGELFCVLFFVTLPQYHYPGGVWAGVEGQPRRRYMRNCGLAQQFERACKYYGSAPTWPIGNAYSHQLTAPSSDAAHAIDRVCDAHFQPCEIWKFDPSTHLRDASVGVAIWQIG